MKTVRVLEDKENQKAAVYINGNLVMEGDFKDFTSDASGVTTYGEFKNYGELAYNVSRYLMTTYTNLLSVKTTFIKANLSVAAR